MRKQPKEQLRQGLALLGLLALTGFAIAGPSGLLAWSENSAKLESHKAHIAALQEKRDELKNRVELLDPSAADPDLVGELLRREMNMVHPDEVVITLDESED
ncbi:septum formation initiator family protein [Altererythrobacter sp. GH1-8]|uniref:FtsB family cell division protein n=1 Tax=Altererythrobacter sp. GH1-8 TaxID=3349333 RepID=UPI00374CD644